MGRVVEVWEFLGFLMRIVFLGFYYLVSLCVIFYSNTWIVVLCLCFIL